MYKGLFRYLIILAFIYFVWTFVLGYFSFLLFLIYIFLFFLSLLLSFSSMGKTNVDCFIEHTIIERGDHLYLSLTRHDSSLIHCGKVIVDYHICNQKNEIVFKQRQSLYDDFAMDVVLLDHCGFYEIVIDRIYCFDFLQCLFKKHKSNQKYQFYIFPKLQETSFHLQDNIGYNQESTEYSPYYKGDDYAEMFDLREYQEGDSLRHIHWKISSKKGELFVKEGSQPIIKKIILAFSLTSYESENDSTLDTLYSLCSMLLKKQIQFEIMCPHRQNDGLCLELIVNENHLRECLKRILQANHISFADLHFQSHEVSSLYRIQGQEIEVIHP